MLGTVTFNFLRGLKIKSFVLDSFNEILLALSQSVSNCSSLFMTQDISEGHLLPNNKPVSSAKCYTMLLSRALLRSFM